MSNLSSLCNAFHASCNNLLVCHLPSGVEWLLCTGHTHGITYEVPLYIHTTLPYIHRAAKPTNTTCQMQLLYNDLRLAISPPTYLYLYCFISDFEPKSLQQHFIVLPIKNLYAYLTCEYRIKLKYYLLRALLINSDGFILAATRFKTHFYLVITLLL